MSGNALAYALGAAVGAEALGVTNFTDGGLDPRTVAALSESGNGLGTGDLRDIVSANSGASAEEIAATIPNPDSGPAIIQLPARARETVQQAREVGGLAGEVRRQAEDLSGQRPQDGQRQASNSPGPTPEDTTKDRGNEGYDTQQDYQGPAAEAVGGGAEALAEAGKTAQEIVESQTATTPDGFTVLKAPYEAGRSAGGAVDQATAWAKGDTGPVGGMVSDINAVQDGWDSLTGGGSGDSNNDEKGGNSDTDSSPNSAADWATSDPLNLSGLTSGDSPTDRMQSGGSASGSSETAVKQRGGGGGGGNSVIDRGMDLLTGSGNGDSGGPNRSAAEQRGGGGSSGGGGGKDLIDKGKELLGI